MREVATGLWHWQAPHPEWSERADWPELVSCYAIDDGRQLLVFDPLAPPGEIEVLARERETTIVLTCPWHRRDAEALAERVGASVRVPPADENDSNPVQGEVFEAGDHFVGIRALPGMEPNDLVLWVESCGALVVGDTLIDRGSGLEVPAEWASEDLALERIQERLRPLLELPVERVLPTHGAPTDRAALERALL